MKFSKALLLILVVIVVIGSASYIATQRQPNSTKVEKVDLIIDFIPNGEHPPFYVGVDQGFFAKHSLLVNIIPNPQGSAGAIRALAGSKADIAEADVGTLLVLMAKENITNVRAIALYHARNPMSVMFVQGEGRPSIKTPKDLEGKTVGDFVGSSVGAMFPTFCKANGIDCSNVKIQYVSAATLNSGMLSGKFDARLGYDYSVADVAAQASKEGMKGLTVGYFAYADYGVNVYANMILTRTDVIKNNPDLIQRFLQGYEEALQSSVAQPDAAVSSIVKFNPQLSPDATRSEWDITAQDMGGKAILTAKDPLMNGWIDPAKMQTTITTVSAAYGVPAPDPSAIYTNQFVKAP